MKTKLAFFALFISLNVSARVRSFPPDTTYKITGVRVVDSVTYVRYSFDKHIA